MLNWPVVFISDDDSQLAAGAGAWLNTGMNWEPSYLTGFLGGCLIGAGSLLALIVTKKIPGISGVFARLLRPESNDIGWRIVFLIGLIGGAALMMGISDTAASYRLPAGRSLFVFALAGLVVGFGTRLGGGCTSGHGVCGMGMGARDSIIATLVFMGAGFGTVFFWNLVSSAS
ncbi:MAG: YeeE/YedE thiosulfate transporter family protein [Verrucomicrobiales bacterium]|nr:YeeE/YedE thiosulfate transporter family protein [Verrucomicrobiales bacterium]